MKEPSNQGPVENRLLVVLNQQAHTAIRHYSGRCLHRCSTCQEPAKPPAKPPARVEELEVMNSVTGWRLNCWSLVVRSCGSCDEDWLIAGLPLTAGAW